MKKTLGVVFLSMNTHTTVYLVLLSICLVLLAVGCIPARVPDNLDDTPGPPVSINDGQYRGVTFSADIPAGWRVITSEAQTPQSVIFVAPDDKTLIRLIAGNVDAEKVVVSNQRNTVESITLADSGVVITAVFSSPYSTWEHYYPEFAKVRGSLGSH